MAAPKKLEMEAAAACRLTAGMSGGMVGEATTESAPQKQKTKSATVNDRMAGMLQNDPDTCINLTRYQWSQKLNCSESAVQDTKTWDIIMGMRAHETMKRARPKTWRRKPKHKPKWTNQTLHFTNQLLIGIRILALQSRAFFMHARLVGRNSPTNHGNVEYRTACCGNQFWLREIGRMPRSLAPERRKLSVPQLARRWGVGTHKVAEFIQSGELRAMNLASNRSSRPRYAIDLDDIAAFEQSRMVVPPIQSVQRWQVTAC
jgi:hypothetical protein